MGLIINTSDFTGKFLVAKNNYTLLDEYINRYEVQYLKELFGTTMYDDFMADFGYPSQNVIYATLYDPFDIDNIQYGVIESSRGIKDMLIGFVYFEFMREQNIKPTNTGLVIGQAENSGPAKVDDYYLYDRYNSSVKTFQTIQWYINDKYNDYLSFNGQYKCYAHWAL